MKSQHQNPTTRTEYNAETSGEPETPMADPTVTNDEEAQTSEGSTTPTPTSAEKKSVKHLECAYYFSQGGCKFLEKDCLYAHHQTGTRAEAPKVVEPGRPPVAGRNAERQNPSYNNWRNTAYELGVAYNPSPGHQHAQANSPASTGNHSIQAPNPHEVGNSPLGLGRGTPPPHSLELRRQLQRIHTKAHSQQSQLPIRNSPAMGRSNLNPNAAPFDRYKVYPGQSGPGPAMSSPMSSPDFSMPGRHPADVFGPQFGGQPGNYANNQGQYLLPGPPAAPPIDMINQYEAALHQYQQEVEERDRIIAQGQMEANQLRAELAATQAKLAEVEADNKRILKGNAVIMDAYMHLEHHDYETMLQYRKHCMKDSKYLLNATHKLQDQALQLYQGDATRKTIEVVRDMQLSVGNNFLVGGGNAADHQDEALRLGAWMKEELAKSGNSEALQQYNSHHCGQGFTWKALLVKDP